MGRLMALVYDRMMRRTEEACIQAWRREVVEDLEGRVLEVGAGTGATLPVFPVTLDRLVLTEPEPNMRRRLAARADSMDGIPVEVRDGDLDHLPFEDGTFDAVVGMLVLCSVPDLGRALGEIRRVLVPGGRFAFLEHVAAEDRPRRLRWQRRLEPIWRRFSGNCHLTRRTEAAIGSAGFELEWIRRDSMRKAMPLVRPTIRGVATWSGG